MNESATLSHVQKSMNALKEPMAVLRSVPTHLEATPAPVILVSSYRQTAMDAMVNSYRTDA